MANETAATETKQTLQTFEMDVESFQKGLSPMIDKQTAHLAELIESSFNKMKPVEKATEKV